MTERVPAYTAAQVRAAELPLLAAGEPLMDRAAAALAAVIREEIPDASTSSATGTGSATGAGSATGSPRILVLAGSGDNGGDALLAAATSLAATPVEVDVLCVGSRVHERGLAAATAAGARVVEATTLEALEPYDLVVDGILGIGTGGDPALRGAARAAVEALLPAVRAGHTRVIAVDLPSGLHPDTGLTADDVVLPADVTVTFGAVKAGLVRGEARARGPDRVRRSRAGVCRTLRTGSATDAYRQRSTTGRRPRPAQRRLVTSPGRQRQAEGAIRQVHRATELRWDLTGRRRRSMMSTASAASSPVQR